MNKHASLMGLFLFCLLVGNNLVHSAEANTVLKKLCDVIIVSNDGKEILCSKYFLYLQNEYFKRLFHFADCQENQVSKITLPFSSKAIRLALAYFRNKNLQKSISMPIYMELNEIAEFLQDKSLKTYVQKCIVDFKNYPLLESLHGAKEHQNGRLVGEILKSIQDQDPTLSIENFLINEIETDNKIITEKLFEIANSQLFRRLEEKHPIKMATLALNNLFLMNKWSKKMWECDFPDELVNKTIVTLLNDLEESLSLEFKNLKITEGQELLYFVACYTCAIQKYYPRLPQGYFSEKDILKDVNWKLFKLNTRFKINYRPAPWRLNIPEYTKNRLNFWRGILSLYSITYGYIKEANWSRGDTFKWYFNFLPTYYKHNNCPWEKKNISREDAFNLISQFWLHSKLKKDPFVQILKRVMEKLFPEEASKRQS